MKTNILLGISFAAGLLTLASCDQSLLDIPKKGVVAYEAFYDGSEESAESAITAAYQAGIKCMNMADMDFSHWNIAPANFVLRNAPSDDCYYGSGGPGDHVFGLEINEYRPSFGSNSTVIVADYKAFYQWIYNCNLVIENFDPSTSSSIARNVAEARVLRALAHLHLAIYWGNPPKIDHIIAADDHPVNCDHAELLDWIAQECEEASASLPSRGSKTNRDLAVRLTKEAAWATEGKALVYNTKYSEAKTVLKKVIDSGVYDLVPGDQMWNIHHSSGDCSPEKVFEFNYVHNVNLSFFGGHTHGQRANSCTWRDLKKIPMPFIQINDGWGGGGNPSKSFVDAIMANEPDSYRRKAWLISYEELLSEYPYTFGEDKEFEYQGATYNLKADEDMTKEEKLMDPRRGLSASSYYGNIGWFMIKYMPLETERPDANDVHKNDNNTPVMRYAEVLLLYAEACAQLGETSGDGLTALNKVASRAGAPTYSALSMANVKKEKRFEMFMEGCRWPDLVRWGDAATVLKDQGKEVPSFTDPFNPAEGIPHSAVIDYSNAYYNSEYGFKAGKNEVMPYPLGEIQLNPWDEETGTGIKQNPNWN